MAPADMARWRVFSIDFLKLAPDTVGFVQMTQVAQRRCEKRARQVRRRIDRDTVPKKTRRSFVVAAHKMGHAKKMDVLLLEGRVEAHRPLNEGDRLGRLSGIDVNGPPYAERGRVVRVE